MTSSNQRVLLHAFSSFNFGGAQARFVQLANTYGTRYQHLVMAMDGNFGAGDRLDKSVQWRQIHMPVKRGGMLANRSAFRSELKALKPDLLLTYNWGSIEWAAANCPKLLPQVHVEDGFGPDESFRQLPRRAWTRRVLLGLARIPVVVASQHLERIARDTWALPARRVKFIVNGVAPRTPKLPSCEGTIPGTLTIGTVAGLRPEKNLVRLVRAFAALRTPCAKRLVIVGDGPERVSLERLVRQLDVAEMVEFAGYQRNPMDWLARFDLFALSSDTEQLPLSMLEAMACGVPMVATRVGDVQDIMPAVAVGALSAPEDVSFSAALQSVVERRTDWPNWVAAGYEVLRSRYGFERMLAEWQRIYDGQWW